MEKIKSKAGKLVAEHDSKKKMMVAFLTELQSPKTQGQVETSLLCFSFKREKRERELKGKWQEPAKKMSLFQLCLFTIDSNI